MNEDTLVAVCCYAGDKDQVVGTLDIHRRHECPILILSPEDSKVEIPHVETRFGGVRQYFGPESLQRQRRHLEILLQFPEKYFFIHDADSLCVEPKLPDEFYAEPDLVWSNQCVDDMPEHHAVMTAGIPHVAFQPPYFLSRKTIESMLAVADKVVVEPTMPFIDYYMVQLTYAAGLPWRKLPHSVCCANGGVLLKLVAREGLTTLHSVKTPKLAHDLVDARQHYVGISK